MKVIIKKTGENDITANRISKKTGKSRKVIPLGLTQEPFGGRCPRY
jgi:hypothetical protein